MNILIIDDDSMLRELVRNFIEDSGLLVQFVEASHTEMALEYLREENSNFSLIISDYHMPGESGMKVIEYWQSNYNYIPFILFSSSADEVKESFKKLYGEIPKRLHFVRKDEGVEGFQYSLLELWRHGFSPLPLKYVKVNTALLADIYIQVNKGNVLKVFNQGESIEESRIRTYQEKGLTHFFVNHVDYFKHKCISCEYPLFEVSDESLGLGEALDSFETSFRDVLEEKILNARSLENNFKQIGLDLITLKDNHLFSFLREMNYNDKNYIINHSFLIILMSSLMLEEIGITSSASRLSVVKAIILHDLFLQDNEDWKRDLYISSLDQKEEQGIFLDEQKLLGKVAELHLDEDTLIIFNALKSGLYEDQNHIAENHQVARIVVSMHKISNELYRKGFGSSVDKRQLEVLFESDSDALKASEKVFIC